MAAMGRMQSARGTTRTRPPPTLPTQPRLARCASCSRQILLAKASVQSQRMPSHFCLCTSASSPAMNADVWCLLCVGMNEGWCWFCRCPTAVSGSLCRQSQPHSGAVWQLPTATQQRATTPALPPTAAARPAAALLAAPPLPGSARTRKLPSRWLPLLRTGSSSSMQVHTLTCNLAH